MDPLFLCESCRGYMGRKDKQPRVLSCGHTFCSLCIPNFFKEGKFRCPACNLQHHYKTTSKIPVNYALLKIIIAKKSYNTKNSKSCKGFLANSKKIVSYSNPDPWSQTMQWDYKANNFNFSLGEPHQHAGKCDRHDKYSTFWCKSCKEWICIDCALISHPPLQCEVCTFTNAISNIKLDEDCIIRKTVQLFNSHAKKYSAKQSALRGMKEKHIIMVKELQRLQTKHQNAATEIDKQISIIKNSLADGLSALWMLLESQKQLLEAQTLDEVLSSRHRTQIYQSKILSWHNPKLLEDTEDIVFSRKEKNAVTNVPEYTIETDDRKKDFKKIDSEDSVFSHSMCFITNARDQQNDKNSATTEERCVRVEKLIDLSTEEQEEESSSECSVLSQKYLTCDKEIIFQPSKKSASAVKRKYSLKEYSEKFTKNARVGKKRKANPKMPKETIVLKESFRLYPWRVPKRPDFSKDGVGNPDCFLEIPTSFQSNGYLDKENDGKEVLSVAKNDKEILKKESSLHKHSESHANLSVILGLAGIKTTNINNELQESPSDVSSSGGSKDEHFFYYAIGGFESSTEVDSSLDDKRK